jgi:hypothetical protein
MTKQTHHLLILLLLAGLSLALLGTGQEAVGYCTVAIFLTASLVALIYSFQE